MTAPDGRGSDLAPLPAPLAAGAPVSRLAHARPARRTGQHAGEQVVTLTCFRFDRTLDRLWQFGRMAGVGVALRRTPGIGWAKMMGTGTGFGFDPRPNFGVWTILATWESADAAREGVASSPVWRRRRARAAESCTLTLRPVASSGRWGGVAPFEPGPAPDAALPVAALTRATIRLRHARAFWARVPAINAQIAAGPGMLFRIGMGEVPLLHQVTFSVWRDAEAMRAFAYRGEGHRTAVACVRRGDWFAEELYARFVVTGTEGSWNGGPPLREG